MTVTLNQSARKRSLQIIDRRGFVSQTSCGICGKELIKDIKQNLTPVDDKTVITKSQAVECIRRLTEAQRLYGKTQSSHAAMLFDTQLKSISMAEDVGRHNDLDKAIGSAFMENKMGGALVAAVTSRVSYELVQKAARAGLAFLLGISRPTELAVKLGNSMNMTIASMKENELLVFCGKERFDTMETGAESTKMNIER